MARPSRNYYELLGVAPGASRDEIHSAYRRLARRYHPDVNAGGDGRFQEVTDAYEVLHDPARRARYDRSTAASGVPAVPATGAARAAPATGAARQAPAFSAAAGKAPVFSAPPPRRDVPRFLDSEPGGLGPSFGLGRGVGFGPRGGVGFGPRGGVGFGPRGGVRVQLVVRWLR